MLGNIQDIKNYLHIVLNMEKFVGNSLQMRFTFEFILLLNSSRSFVVWGSRGSFVDVLWVEPAGTWLESSKLSGSDLMSSRLVVAEVLVESFTEVSMEVSMGLVWFKLLDSKLGWVMLLMYKLEWFTLVGSMPGGSRA